MSYPEADQQTDQMGEAGATQNSSEQSSEKGRPSPKGGEAGLQKLVGKFARRSREDSLQELESEADGIYKRLDEVELTARETAKALASLDKRVGKALNEIVRQVQKAAVSQETMVEQILERLRSDVADQQSAAQQFHNVALIKVDDVAAAVSGIKGSLSGMQGVLDDNNKLVQRFEDGYDYQILKSFVRQIARVIAHLDKQLETVVDADARVAVMDARDDLIDVLEHNGIEPYKPRQGSAYAGQEKLVELEPERIATEDPAQKGTIATVKRAGYVYRLGTEQARVIQTAQVCLYE